MLLRRRVHARPSPLAENDSETAEVDETAVNNNDDVDVLDLEVERSIDVIPEVTPASSVSGSPTPVSSERTERKKTTRPLLTDTATGHSTTSV